MQYSALSIATISIAEIILATGLTVLTISDKTLSCVLIFAIVFTLSESGSTYFDASDWGAYASVTDEIAERSIFFQDGIFWKLLLKANNLENFDFLFHFAIKIISIIFIFSTLHCMGMGNKAILLGTILWVGSNGYALSTDWYIRQGLANSMLVYGIAFVLYKFYNIKTKGELQFFKSITINALIFSVFLIALLIHSGSGLNIVLFAISYFFSNLFLSKRSKYMLVLRIKGHGASYLPFILMATFSVMTLQILYYNFDNILPESFTIFSETSFPRMVIPLMVFLIISINLLDSMKGCAELNLVDFMRLQRHKITVRLLLGVQVLFLTIYPFFPYLMRGNIFRDMFLVVAIAALVDLSIVFRLHARYLRSYKPLLMFGCILLVLPYLNIFLFYVT